MINPTSLSYLILDTIDIEIGLKVNATGGESCAIIYRIRPAGAGSQMLDLPNQRIRSLRTQTPVAFDDRCLNYEL